MCFLNYNLYFIDNNDYIQIGNITNKNYYIGTYSAYYYISFNRSFKYLYRYNIHFY